MPVRIRMLNTKLRVRSAFALKKLSNRLKGSGRSVVRKKAANMMRIAAKKVFSGRQRERDLAIDLTKLEIDETGVLDFLDWLRALKKRQKLKHFTSARHFLREMLFAGEKNRILFVIPPYAAFAANPQLEFELSKLAFFHDWVRTTGNEIVAKARQYRRYFYVDSKKAYGELVFTNEKSRGMSIFVPPISEKEQRGWELLWSSKGRAPPLVFQHPNKTKIIRLLASGPHLFEVYFFDPHYPERDRIVKAEYFDD